MGSARPTRVTIGIPKAMVFPEPVGAWPHTSRPAQPSGMVRAWIGSGFSMPWAAKVAASGPGTSRSMKETDIVFDCSGIRFHQRWINGSGLTRRTHPETLIRRRRNCAERPRSRADEPANPVNVPRRTADGHQQDKSHDTTPSG